MTKKRCNSEKYGRDVDLKGIQVENQGEKHTPTQPRSVFHKIVDATV